MGVKKVTLNKKTILLHKVNIYFSIDINFLISFSACAIYESDYESLAIFFGLFILGLSSAIGYVRRDMAFHDDSLVFRYLGALVISCIFVYITYINTSFIVAIIPVIAVIIEFLMIFVIIYRYKIRNKIIKLFKKK